MMNMKNFIALLFWSSATLLQAQEPATEITIKGKIEGIASGKLYLLAQTGEEKQDTLGSCQFKKSKFELKAKLNEPMVTQLIVDGYQGGFRLLAEPGTTYKALLTNDSRSYIRGGKLQDDYETHMIFADSLRNLIQEVRTRYEAHKAQNKFRSASQANDTLRRAEQLLQQKTQQFLSQHDDLITAYTFQTNALMKEAGLAESKRMYENMGPGAKATLSGRLMKERIDRMEKTQGGAVAPDFTLQDLNGKEVTLSKVPGKIKILDFWASWCGPCMREVPYLVDTYKKYHNKGFEIYGVSFDRAREPWLKAIEEKELDWVHVSAVNYWDNKARHDYAVNSIPANFLVDCATGQIIAKGLRGEQVAEKIGELLK